MKERDVIGHLRAAFGTWGLGDDAAVLAPPGGDLLVASDAVVEGVHFRREHATICQVLQKVITSNVSDIYAMGGSPHAILLTAGLPPGFGKVDVNGIIEGVELACRAYGVRLAGGDTVRSPGGCFFDVAITGSVAGGRAVPRSGARPGDAIVLFGECGGSLAGMLLLDHLRGAATREISRGGEEAPRPRDAVFAKLLQELAPVDRMTLAGIRRVAPELALTMETSEIERLCSAHGLKAETAPLVRLLKQHLVPLARPLDRALLASSETPVTAMIDVSDGLSKDLATLCAESGVGAVIEETAIPAPEPIAPYADSMTREETTRLLLSSGEEYVLLAAIRELESGPGPAAGSVIGRIVDRREGLALLTADGGRAPWPELGYEHSF